jgi:hypothetical protein
MSLPILVLAGALLGLIVEHLSHRRSAAQPLAQDQDLERRLIALAAAQPGLAAALDLPVVAFTLLEHQATWSELAAHAPLEDITADAARDAATLRACYEDREMFPSRTPIVEVNGRLHRLPPAVGLLRRILTALLAAGGFALSAEVFSGLALVAACVVVLTALIIALVDIDTLLIDLGAYLAGYGVAFALLVADAFISGDTSKLMLSVVLGLGSAFGLFAFTFAYSKLRKIQTMGFGDVLLYAAAGTVALLATGNPMSLYYALLLGAVAGFVTWVCTAVSHRGGGSRLQIPFPFGPGIALGAFLAMVLL